MEYEQLKQLTDLQIIKEQLLTYKLKQDALEQELKQLELNKLRILETVDRLEEFRPLLKQALDRAKDFKQTIDESWGPLIEGCTRIVALDTEQESIDKCIQILQDIDDLKECYANTEHAISSNNLQLACEWIHKSLDYDVDLISRIYSETQVLDNPSDNDYGLMGPSPVGRLAELHQKLTDMVITAFDNALTGKQPNELVRIFKLFPAIGRASLGLEKFSAYICDFVAENCALELEASNDRGSEHVHVELLTKLFETVAKMIDQQTSLVETHYGPGSILVVIQALQTEVDKQGCILVNQFKEERQLDKKLYDIRKQQDIAFSSKNTQQQQNQQQKDEQELDPRGLDLVVTEITSICQKAQLFDRFIRIRSEGKRELIEEYYKAHPRSIPPPNSKANQSSKLAEQIQGISVTFVVLSDYFVKIGISKALKIDQVENASLVSTCVDDVFYILKKSILRGCATGDPNSLCALINSLSRTLEVDFLNVLQKKVAASFNNTQDISKDAGKAQFMTLSNNIDTSCEYMLKLVGLVENELHGSFKDAADLEKEKIRSCLDSLKEYSRHFSSVLKTWLENYFTMAIKPKMKSLFQNIGLELSYNLDEMQAEQADRNQTFLRKSDKFFKSTLDPLKTTLTQKNREILTNFVIDHFTREWERIIMSLQFNQLGAGKLDMDVRGIVTLCMDNGWAPREKFTRISQVSLVLNTTVHDEILEYWGFSGSTIWRLSASQVKKLLVLRVEFDKKQVEQLAL